MHARLTSKCFFFFIITLACISSYASPSNSPEESLALEETLFLYDTDEVEVILPVAITQKISALALLILYESFFIDFRYDKNDLAMLVECKNTFAQDIVDINDIYCPFHAFASWFWYIEQTQTPTIPLNLLRYLFCTQEIILETIGYHRGYNPSYISAPHAPDSISTENLLANLQEITEFQSRAALDALKTVISFLHIHIGKKRLSQVSTFIRHSKLNGKPFNFYFKLIRETFIDEPLAVLDKLEQQLITPYPFLPS